MMWLCRLIGHDWGILGTQVDNEYGVGEYATYHTFVLYRCHKCFKTKVKRLAGNWEKDLP